MFRKLLSVSLASLLTAMIATVPSFAQSPATTQLTQAEEIKVRVMRIGVGRARVAVKLRNHMKLKGFIGQIADDGFSLVDPKSGTVTPVPYDQVLQVKNINRSAFVGLAIAVGTVTGLWLLIALSLRGS